MNTEKTFDLNLSAAELEILYFALNAYSLKYINKSVTWGNAEAFLENNGPDYAHRKANEIDHLQVRVGDIMTNNN
jgi:hypothetical protein